MTTTDEGLAQVFDSNTDFVVNSESISNKTCVKAAFQLDNVSTMEKIDRHLIPYDKTDIKVSSEKKKSKPFCRFEKRKKLVQEDKKVIEEDLISEASSDISSTTSLHSITGDCSIMNGNWTLKAPFELPEVHGGKAKNKALEAQVQMKRLNKKLDFIRAENEHYAHLVKEIPDYKQEVFDLKSNNFQLQRENANLKSQLEALLNESLNEKIEEINEEDIKICDHNSIVQDYKIQLRQNQDENFALKSEITKLKLDLKGKEDEVKRLEATHDALDNATLELASNNQKLQQKVRELEANQSSWQRSKLALEQNVNVFQGERESLVKSRDFYRDQMRLAQESRSEIQHALINVQAEVAGKSNQIEKLKIELLQSNKTLEEEREKGLQEKEEMKRQLEELEVSLLASEAAHSLVLSEDNEIDFEDENDEKIQLEVLKNDLRGLELKKDELEFENSSLKDENQELKKKFECAKLDLYKLNDDYKNFNASKLVLEEDLERKEKLVQDLKEQKIDLEINFSKSKSDYNELRSDLQKTLDENHDLKNDLRKEKEKLAKCQNEFDVLNLDFKHSKSELSKLKDEISAAKETQEENITLKKQLLQHDHELLDENKGLKEAFEASDEARKELENAFDILNEEYELLKTELSNTENYHKEVELKSKEISELKETIDAKNMEIEAFRNELEDLKTASKSIEINEESDEEINCKKISRLECSLKVYEDEIRRLTCKILELEEQILTLEHKNGRLIMDSNQNMTLKNTIQKLQEEIAKDTALRRELLSSLELAKSSLKSEIDSLEKGLKNEKEAHCETKNKLMLQEHESSALRVDRRSLRTGLETANLTIEKLQQEMNILKSAKSFEKPPVDSITKELELSQAQLREVKLAFEDAKRTINSLEDQQSELKIQLSHKTSELNNLQSLNQTKEEAVNTEISELRSKSDNLRLEVINLTRKVDKLSAEKNGYRAQVQDMNMALKNSLEHIKRLRTTQSVENQEEWNDLLLTSKKFSTPSPIEEGSGQQKQNLANLQNCLASLKYEMAVLQKKLAPSASNSPVKRPKVQSELGVIPKSE